MMLEGRIVYDGQWNEKNQRHGRGKQYWPTGCIYEGMWS